MRQLQPLQIELFKTFYKEYQMKTIAALIFSLFSTSVFAHSSHMTDDDAPPSEKNEMKKKESEKRMQNKLPNKKDASQPAPKSSEKKSEEKK